MDVFIEWEGVKILAECILMLENYMKGRVCGIDGQKLKTIFTVMICSWKGHSLCFCYLKKWVFFHRAGHADWHVSTMDWPITDSREVLLHFHVFSTFSWLQSTTSPLDATKSWTLNLYILDGQNKKDQKSDHFGTVIYKCIRQPANFNNSQLLTVWEQ